MKKKPAKGPPPKAKKKKPAVKKEGQEKFSLKRQPKDKILPKIARRCDYKNEQAFLSALPLLALDPDVERKSRRNALTSGVAAAFPFASYELSDRNGVFLGLNLYNRSPVFLGPYDDYKYTNGNCWIGGSSGAGKTFTLQCLGGRLRQQGRRVIFTVPKKDHEFRPLCELLGGLYLWMSPSSRDCPNIMAIRRRSLDSYAGLRDMAARDDSVLADKISRLIIWYSLQKRDLSDEDKNHLDSSLVECYRQYGVTFDNATITGENGDFVEMPIVADWYKVLADNPETKHLSVVLARYVTGSASAMGARNDIDLDNKYIVLDTSGMPDDLLRPGIFWATDIANDLDLDRGLTVEERQEWNSIYASYRGRSALSGTIIGVDPHSISVRNQQSGRMERQTMYCAIVIPYRVRVVIPATEMWEAGHERPDFVLQNMVGATIDFIIIKVDRESSFAIGSRRLAAKSRRYFFAHRPALCREGARLKCRLLSVGPRRCLVECYATTST